MIVRSCFEVGALVTLRKQRRLSLGRPVLCLRFMFVRRCHTVSYVGSGDNAAASPDEPPDSRSTNHSA